ncbi:DUF3027 domain-containing protein [Streptomyces sp. NPDC055254]
MTTTALRLTENPERELAMHRSHVIKEPGGVAEIHARWIQRRNRGLNEADYQEEWYSEQCGACRFWIPLAGRMGNDYGACANGVSRFDGIVRFEHDGCEVFEKSGQWAVPDDF